MHARRTRPDPNPVDRRRLLSAGLSALVPGMGQLVDRRPRLAALFLLPFLALVLIVGLLFATRSPGSLAASVADPRVLGTLLVLNGLLLAARLASVLIAFVDTRRVGPTGRLGLTGLALLAVFVVVPHTLVHIYGTAFGSTFERMFEPAEPGPGTGQQASPRPLDERVNVLLIGVDKTRLRDTTLTDTMIVASIDPVGHTATLLSVPRDLIGVPLGDGDRYGPKINSLLMYADAHPDEFPDGGAAALRRAIGALLGIEIPYHAEMHFGGFIDMVDAVGGVTVQVDEGFTDPTYDGYGMEGRGFSVEPGEHRLDGVHALAYARARKATGESDFTRAARQQQILLALRDAVTDDGSLLWELPALLDAVGETIRTNLPRNVLPALAAVVDEIEDEDIIRAVIRHPLVRSRDTQYGSSLVPRLKRIREVAAHLFPAPGVEPVPWPTPEPTRAPEAGSED